MMAVGQMITIFLIINIYCRYNYALTNFRKWSMNLMGYEKDEHAVSKQGNIHFLRENKHMRFPRNVLNSGKCHLTKCNTGAFVGVPLNISATCEFLRTATVYYKIAWKPPYSEKDLIKSYLLMFRSNDTTHCCRLDKVRNRFDFDKDHGFDTSKRYNITVSAVSGVNNKILSQGVIETDKCPADIKVHPLPSPQIDAGKNFTFHCTYEGRPDPKVYQIKWMFTNDITGCLNLGTLYNNKHVTISEDRKNLEILYATKDQEGCYLCSVSNDMPNESEERAYLKVTVKKQNKKNVLPLIFCGITGGFLLVVAVIMIYKYFIKRKPIVLSPPDQNPKCVVYISHCAKGERNKRKLLKFANLLQEQYGVEVIIDLASNIEINNAGGMCQWLPQEMKRANKIMVVLSKDYLETLRSQDRHVENVCKVNAEISEVRKIIYNDCQRTRRLVVISDGVNPEDFPDSFKGRSYFLFPKCTGTYDIYRIVGVLYDEEVIQLPTQQLL